MAWRFATGTAWHPSNGSPRAPVWLWSSASPAARESACYVAKDANRAIPQAETDERFRREPGTAGSNQLSVIDPQRGDAVIKQIPVGLYPSGLGIDVAGRRLYVGNAMGSSVTVVDLDTLEAVGTVPAEVGAGAVAVDVERQRAYCVNFLVGSVTVHRYAGPDGAEPHRGRGRSLCRCGEPGRRRRVRRQFGGRHGVAHRS